MAWLMATKKPETPEPRTITSPWLTEKEAAEYCRCSLWSFRAINLPAPRGAFEVRSSQRFSKFNVRSKPEASQVSPTSRAACIAAFRILVWRIESGMDVLSWRLWRAYCDWSAP